MVMPRDQLEGEVADLVIPVVINEGYCSPNERVAITLRGPAVVNKIES